MSKDIFLSVVIPVFNEEATIKDVISAHAAVLTRFADRLAGAEIVCLDDASTDGTWRALEAVAPEHPSLRIVRHRVNQGIVLSFMELFRQAAGSHVYVTAGDGQWPAVDLERLLDAQMKTNADVVIGVRQERGKVYGPGRMLLSYGFNFGAFVLFGINARDANGIKLARREFFQLPVSSRSFFAEIERLIVARRQGMAIAHAPVEFVSRCAGHEKGAAWKNVRATVLDMARFFCNRKGR